MITENQQKSPETPIFIVRKRRGPVINQLGGPVINH